MFFHSYTINSNFGSFDNFFYSGFLIRTPSPGNMAKYFIIAELAACSVHSVAPLLYKIVVTHEAKKIWTYDRTRCYFQHARPTVLWACQHHSFSLVQWTFEHNATLLRICSNPSSRKNLDLGPYDRPTAQGAAFSMRGQLHCGHNLSHYVTEGRGRR